LVTHNNNTEYQNKKQNHLLPGPGEKFINNSRYGLLMVYTKKNGGGLKIPDKILHPWHNQFPETNSPTWYN